MCDLARLIAREVGFTGEILWDTSRPNGQPRRCLDVSRASRAFGWRAEVDFVEGVRRTIAWFHQECGNAEAMTEGQQNSCVNEYPPGG
jgi:GDP-L-fucose synthase